MEENNEIVSVNDLVNIGKLNNDIVDTTKKIAEEDKPETIQELMKLFNLQEHKKSTLRALKYSELLDRISDEMLVRFNKYHNQFSTDDLLRYLQSAQTAIDKSTKANIDLENIPNITINQVNVGNQEEEKLTREERENVLKALKAIQQFSQEKKDNEEIVIEMNGEEDNGTI